jgi:hypothetical protein
MVTPAGAADFSGSIVVSCALSYSCGLGSGGKPQIRDRAMEALLRLFPSWDIVSESPTARVSAKRVVAGQLCKVQVCSLAKVVRRAEVGSRLGFGSRMSRRVRRVLLLAVLLWSRSCGGACPGGNDDRPPVAPQSSRSAQAQHISLVKLAV